MAEFLNQEKPEPLDGFNAMGKPIPFYRKQAGYEQCRMMGLDENGAFAAVNGMADSLERDEPYDALEKGMVYLDLTGCYRLMAYLLTAEQKKS